MSNIDNFKEFVKKNPKLISHVKNQTMTWQKFYEIYSLYGEDNSAWKDYLSNPEENISIPKIGLNDIIGWVKRVDLDSVQNGVNSLQRVVGVLKDLSTKSENNPIKPVYEPRPLYRHFED